MSYSSEVLADAPRAWWRLGDASGLPQDSSGNALHMEVTDGAPAYSQTGAINGDSNTAISFNGTTAFEKAPSASFDLGDIFTIEAWVKRGTAAGGTYGILGKGGTYYIRINSSDRFQLEAAGTADVVASTITITDTTAWHHCVATKNGAAVFLYVDGIDVTGAITPYTFTNTGSNVDIGANGFGTAGEFFNGLIDEVAIYPTALTSTRVIAHYLAARPAALGAFQ